MASIKFRASILTLVLLSLGAGAASMAEPARTNPERQSLRTESRLTFPIPADLTPRLLSPEALAMERRKAALEKIGLGPRGQEFPELERSGSRPMGFLRSGGPRPVLTTYTGIWCTRRTR